MKKLLIILVSAIVVQSCTKDNDNFNVQPEKINLDKLKINEIIMAITIAIAVYKSLFKTSVCVKKVFISFQNSENILKNIILCSPFSLIFLLLINDIRGFQLNYKKKIKHPFL